MVNRADLSFKTNKHAHIFQRFETINLLLFAGKINLNNADESKSDLLIEVVDLKKSKTKPTDIKRKKRKRYTLKSMQ